MNSGLVASVAWVTTDLGVTEPKAEEAPHIAATTQQDEDWSYRLFEEATAQESPPRRSIRRYQAPEMPVESAPAFVSLPITEQYSPAQVHPKEHKASLKPRFESYSAPEVFSSGLRVNLQNPGRGDQDEDLPFSTTPEDAESSPPLFSVDSGYDDSGDSDGDHYPDYADSHPGNRQLWNDWNRDGYNDYSTSELLYILNNGVAPNLTVWLNTSNSSSSFNYWNEWRGSSGLVLTRVSFERNNSRLTLDSTTDQSVINEPPAEPVDVAPAENDPGDRSSLEPVENDPL